jgi:hypothetical protein
VADKITAADLARVKKFASLKKSSVLVIFFDDIESSGLVKQNIGEVDYQKIRKYHDRTLEEIINKKTRAKLSNHWETVCLPLYRERHPDGCFPWSTHEKHDPVALSVPFSACRNPIKDLISRQ